MDSKKTGSTTESSTRREFIKKASTAAAVVATTNMFKTPVYGQTQAPPSGRIIGANDRIMVGYIGVGKQGTVHVNTQKGDAGANNIAQIAACDLSKTKIDAAKETIGADCKTYDDHRKLLENKDIDAVTIATVDHWHAQCAIDALNAGKHVYVEKPVTRYLAELWDLEKAVKNSGKKLQAGAQICSDARWAKARDLILAGKIGKMVLAQDSYMRNTPAGEWNYPIEEWAKPGDVNWDRWQGNVATKTGFNADSFFRWRKYYRYCAGLLGDLAPHRLHPLMLATGAPEFPVRVVCVGTKSIDTDSKAVPPTPQRDSPDQIEIIAEFPSGLNLLVSCGTVNQIGLTSMIRGQKATLYMGSAGVELKPEPPFADEIDPENYEHLTPSGEKIPEMEKDWFKCIRDKTEPLAGIDLAVRVQTVISLAEMSQRLNIVCLFDEKTRKITTGDGKEVSPLYYGSIPNLS